MTTTNNNDNWVKTKFRDAVQIGIDNQEYTSCAYCSNNPKYLVLTNLGWTQPVCNMHLLQFGKQRKTYV